MNAQNIQLLKTAAQGLDKTQVYTFLEGFYAGSDLAAVAAQPAKAVEKEKKITNHVRKPRKVAKASKATKDAVKPATERRKHGEIEALLLNNLPNSLTGAMSLGEIASKIGVTNTISVNGPLKKLIKAEKVVVQGNGGRGDPFHYSLATTEA